MASLAVSRSCTRDRNMSQGSTGSVFWLLWLSRGKGVRPSTLHTTHKHTSHVALTVLVVLGASSDCDHTPTCRLQAQ